MGLCFHTHNQKIAIKWCVCRVDAGKLLFVPTEFCPDSV